MARIEKRPNAPAKIGNVRPSAPPFGAACSRCGDKATKRWLNAYRASDSCSLTECSDKEFQWVGNFPVRPPATATPTRKPESNTDSKEDKRAFVAKTGERKAPPKKTRAMNFNDPDVKARMYGKLF